MDNVIDFAEKKLERFRKENELELDTEIVTTVRQVEAVATEIIMEYAEKYDFLEMLCAKLEDELDGHE